MAPTVHRTFEESLFITYNRAHLETKGEETERKAKLSYHLRILQVEKQCENRAMDGQTVTTDC